jgi:uncharacterized protein YqgV (UPF0045/DUF77 family)
VPVGPDRFLLVEENEEVQFQKDAPRSVTALQVDAKAGQTLVAKRVAD